MATRSPRAAPSSPGDVVQQIHDRLAEHGARLEEHRVRLAAQREALSQSGARSELTLSPTINAMSRRIQRTGSVEDILRTAGKTYAEKLEQKRQQAIQEAAKEITLSPQITPIAKRMSRDGSVHERLNHVQKEREHKLQQARETIEKEKEEQIKEAGFTPRINKSSKRLSRPASVGELLYQWGQDARKKQEAERQKVEQERQAEITLSPSISERSRKLAARVRQGKVEDQLLELATSLQHQRDTASELYLLNTVPGYPRITERAASLVRTGDVGERLYQMSLQKQQKLAELREAQQRLAEEMARAPGSPTRHVEEELLRRGEEAELKRELQRQKIEAAEAARHRPQLNPHSIEIEQRLPHTTAERLTRTPQRSVSPPRDSNLTFKPELNAASIALAEVRAARGQTPADRVQALIRAKEERDRRLQEQRARKQDEEMKECTFKPQIPRAHAHAPEQQRNVIDRLTLWHQKRESRLAAERAEKEKLSMKECTFHPQIDGDGQSAVSVSGSEQQQQGLDLSAGMQRPSTARAYGFEKFVERQKEGRAIRQQRQEIPHATGEKWKPVPTQPEEFHFSQRVSVRSLEKPHISAAQSRPRSAPMHGRLNGSVSGTGAAVTAPVVTPGAAPVTFNEFISTLRAAWDEDDESNEQTATHGHSNAHYASTPAAAAAGRDSDDGAAATMERIAQLLADLGTPSGSLNGDSTAAAVTEALVSGAVGSSSTGAAGAVVASSGPSAEWLRRSREKHEAERAQQETEVDRDDDSLRPWRDASPAYDSPRQQQQQPSTPRTGENEFVERMARARQRREEQNPDRVFPDGSRWRPQTTVPLEFKFHTDSRSKEKDTPRSAVQKVAV